MYDHKLSQFVIYRHIDLLHLSIAGVTCVVQAFVTSRT